MRILQITPGSGGTFYCENCLRDAGLVTALRKLGHDVHMVPLYLPLLADVAAPQAEEVFFGGINVYLQQKSGLFRRTPRWLDKLLDSPKLLTWASGRAGMTSARDLAETTLSMLRGPAGRQKKELERLVGFLRSQERPDVIVLSNALLLGLAGELRRRVGAPVAVLLQDEDIFIDELPEPYCARTWELTGELARQADACIAVSDFYASRMRDRLGVSDERLYVVYSGIDPAGYAPPDDPPTPRAIGYLDRMAEPFGLDLLAEAFIQLKGQRGFEDLRLRIAGGRTAADDAYIATVRRRLGEAGVSEQTDFVPDFDRPARQHFLQTLRVLSVPARHAEAFGMYVIESLASGVPVVLPRRGAFPELIGAAGGGVLCKPDDPAALAETLAQLLNDPIAAQQMGLSGRAGVLEKFTLDRTALAMTEILSGL